MDMKEKPKCNCGLEMIVIEYKGYYDTFKFWGFDPKCECPRSIRECDLEADKTKMGAYA